MIKLEKGDYVKELTEQQFNELQDIERSNFRFSFPDADVDSFELFKNGLCYFENILDHSWRRQCTNLLSFDEFKERAINTFKKC